jgi:uncharacterized protein YnzC (UPF0291/DUF896 family)
LNGKAEKTMEKAKIDRINELAHKSKGEGLTDAEKEEQRLLRQEFLAEIRADVRASLESIEIVEESVQRSDEFIS